MHDGSLNEISTMREWMESFQGRSIRPSRSDMGPKMKFPVLAEGHNGRGKNYM
jgi:hypothetical protein